MAISKTEILKLSFHYLPGKKTLLWYKLQFMLDQEMMDLLICTQNKKEILGSFLNLKKV